MKANGINSVKTGYVGKIIPNGEYHHGQWMVNHYHKVIVEAAKKKVAVNAHEPIKDTGKRRTYPNAISREGLRGQEFNAWSIEGGNPTNHLPTVAFTRSLRISLAGSGSPFKKRSIASSNSAAANSGSSWARLLTVALKSLVSAMVFTS